MGEDNGPPKVFDSCFGILCLQRHAVFYCMSASSKSTFATDCLLTPCTWSIKPPKIFFKKEVKIKKGVWNISRGSTRSGLLTSLSTIA